MSRPATTWLAFAACLLLVLGSMGWASLTVLRLDDESSQARRQAVLEENIRLALWRMDSAIAQLVGRENARPYYAYQAFYPAERAYTRMLARIQSGDVLVSSPLLTEEFPRIRIHFQVEAGGQLTSPQAPGGNLRDLAESGYTTHEKITQAGRLLEDLQTRIDPGALLAQLPVVPPEPDPRMAVAQDVARARREPQRAEPDQAGQQEQQAAWVAQANDDIQGRRNLEAQQQLNTIEWKARNKAARQAVNPSSLANLAVPRMAGEVPGSGLQVGPMQAVWMQSALLLARRVRSEGRTYIQGCWLDWERIRTDLLEDVRELLPRATLRPTRSGEEPRPTRRLASLPVTLVPGPLAVAALPGLSPIQISLLIAWACVLLAALAVGVLLRGAVALSERRGAFVSAVTHELRTPLTTFRMYTEMLAEGMVRDERKRQQYLETLHAEADRLDHLVQNVLAYARLERNRSGGEITEVRAGDLLDRIQERLSERARQAEMQLVVELDDAERDRLIRVDASAVERILFNLVDNASKYAAGAEDRRIHVQGGIPGARATGHLAFRIRDHGAGLGPRASGHLFKPFSKSAKEAAESAPGVGLGLALSRRLALEMGGDLRVDESVVDGACFVLLLPVA